MKVKALRSIDEIKKVEAMLRSKEGSPTVYSDLWKIGCNLGLRIGDLLSLKYEDVKGDRLFIKTKKTSKRLNIKLSETVKSLIDSRYQSHKDDEYLFESDKRRYKGKPLSERAVQQRFEKVSEDLGIPFNTHSMRKSKARVMWEQGVPLEVISDLLGHSSTTVTRRYIDLDQDDMDKANEEHQIIF